jgi:hypothetical protein
VAVTWGCEWADQSPAVQEADPGIAADPGHEPWAPGPDVEAIGPHDPGHDPVYPEAYDPGSNDPEALDPGGHDPGWIEETHCDPPVPCEMQCPYPYGQSWCSGGVVVTRWTVPNACFGYPDIECEVAKACPAGTHCLDQQVPPAASDCWAAVVSSWCGQDCVPDCKYKECGSDGCGGNCGYCPYGQACSTDFRCLNVTPECTLPSSWYPVGATVTLSTPGSADTAVIKSLCPDRTGDGQGDNGLKSLASTINPEFQKAIDAGSLAILFEFKWVEDFANTPVFTLNGLFGSKAMGAPDQYMVQESSYDLSTPGGECPPRISFNDAKIVNGKLATGPGMFAFAIPAGGLDAFTLLLEDTVVSATIKDGAVSASDGIIGGVLTKEAVDQMIAQWEAQCQVNPTDACSYLGTAKAFLPMLFDLDQDKDGKKDAASICLRFTLEAAKIVGVY